MIEGITIETKTGCNSSCTICPNHYTPRPPHMMSLTEFKTILEAFPHLKGVTLCGMYEPLTDPRLNDILDAISHVQPQAEATIFTNGALLHTAMREMLLSHTNLKNLIISIHGYTAKAYEAIMQGLNRDNVYANVEELVHLRGSKQTPRVSVSFVRIKQNIHELPDFRAFWKGKVDVVSDFEVCSWQGQVPVDALYYAQPTGRRECPMFDKPLVIDAYGNIVLCCYCFTYNYGHVLAGGLEKWLNKQRISDTYPLSECKKCNGWTFP
jgi:hypothetical protein